MKSKIPTILLSFIWILTNGSGEIGALEVKEGCASRSYGDGKVVCVCSEEYCDELEDIILEPKGRFLEYTSTRSGLRLEKKLGTFTHCSKDYNSNKLCSLERKEEFDYEMGNEIENRIHEVKLILRRDVKYQKILGFGGAFTDAAGINIRKLPESLQRSLISSYFGKTGIGYSVGRIPIGGSDFSPRAYTYDDNPGDIHLANFSLQEEDHMFKIPYVQMAKSLYPPLKLFASPWSAPPWMKTNNDYWGRGVLREEYFQIWANYFVKFLKSYEQENIKIWGITTQNEPLDGLVPFFPFNSMGWMSLKMKDWIKNNLGPTLKKEGYSHVKIMTLDESTVAIPTWLNGIMSDKEAASYVHGIGIHWYSNFWTKYQPMNATHHSYPDKFILATEACSGFLPWEWEKVSLGSWDRGEAYAEDIIRNLQNWVVGWIDWNIALNPKGGPNWAGHAADSPIIVNATAREFYKQPMFYSMAHVAKFFVPGSHVMLMDSISKEKGLNAAEEEVIAVAAERPDSTTTLMILNKKSRDVTIQLSDENRGLSFIQMPPRSIKTIVYR